jgi:hypothetical protein
MKIYGTKFTISAKYERPLHELFRKNLIFEFTVVYYYEHNNREMVPHFQ